MQNLHDFSDISFWQQLQKSHSPLTQIISSPAGIDVYVLVCFLFFWYFWLVGISITKEKKKLSSTSLVCCTESSFPWVYKGLAALTLTWHRCRRWESWCILWNGGIELDWICIGHWSCQWPAMICVKLWDRNSGVSHTLSCQPLYLEWQQIRGRENEWQILLGLVYVMINIFQLSCCFIEPKGYFFPF